MQREGLGGVGERHWAFTGGVEAFEQVHASGDHANTSRAAGHGFALCRWVDEERHSGPEEEDAEEREREQKQIPSSPGVNGEKGRESKDPIQNPSAHGGKQGRALTVATVDEDGGRVVGNDVDTAKLLHEHDNPSGKRGPAVTWDAEELPEHGEEVLAAVDTLLDFDTDVAVVEIAGGLDVRGAESLEGAESLCHLAVLDEPSGRFRAEVDLTHDDQGEHDGRTKHETPGQIGLEAAKCDTDDVAQHDTECSPHLPLHDQGAANGSWRAFGRVHRNSGRLGANTKTEDESSNEEVDP